jgi:HlyD family secretion protein
MFSKGTPKTYALQIALSTRWSNDAYTIDSVVSQGTTLLTLMPIDEPLQAEVMINNEDVGFVDEGQRVKVKLAAYPFQKDGTVHGTVPHVSADANDQSQGKPNPGDQGGQDSQTNDQAGYKAIVTLNAQPLKANGKTFNLTPGMQVAAELNQGQRTILEYLLSPVQGEFMEERRYQTPVPGLAKRHLISTRVRHMIFLWPCHETHSAGVESAACAVRTLRTTRGAVSVDVFGRQLANM